MMNATGRIGEKIAADYLESLGMTTLERNLRYSGCEIDLVMRDGETIVFVEVKTRRYGTEQSAYDAVTNAKRGRVSKAALKYIHENGLHNTHVRFDVVIIVGEMPEVCIEHVKNAFLFSGARYFV